MHSTQDNADLCQLHLIPLNWERDIKTNLCHYLGIAFPIIIFR